MDKQGSGGGTEESIGGETASYVRSTNLQWETVHSIVVKSSPEQYPPLSRMPTKGVVSIHASPSLRHTHFSVSITDYWLSVFTPSPATLH